MYTKKYLMVDAVQLRIVQPPGDPRWRPGARASTLHVMLAACRQGQLLRHDRRPQRLHYQGNAL